MTDLTDRQLLGIMGGIALLSIVCACMIGSTPMSVSRMISALLMTGSAGDIIVLWEIRLPRALAAFLVGAALAISGASLQGLLRNPLAEPGVLGVSASASLGATLTLFYGLATFSPIVPVFAAISGAVVATAFLAFAAFHNASMTTLILIGVGVSSFAGGLMALLLNLAPNPFSLAELISWTLGSVANRSHADILMVLPFIVIGLALILSIRRNLSALSLGENTAQSLGVNLRRTRLFVIIGTGLMTGASVAIAGAIGFVGIVAPHLVRPLVHYDPARIIWPSAMLGGTMLVLADIGVRLIPTNAELRLGVVAALIGAPLFIWIAANLRRTHD
ncbi:MAG: iron ABC transporter permease [Aquisalinus sp.]|nr:iron ABC transporter permease [Aquisalinus sp.]